MYDRQTESLWSQARRAAVTGPMSGTELGVLPSTLTSWRKWRQKHPQTEVLSLETGYQRNYRQDPYADYYASKKGFFSFFNPGPDEEEKALVAGVVIDGRARAYPVDLLRSQSRLTDTVADTALTLSYTADNDQVHIRTAAGKEIVPLILYWFVWKSMYPETALFKVSED